MYLKVSLIVSNDNKKQYKRGQKNSNFLLSAYCTTDRTAHVINPCVTGHKGWKSKEKRKVN